MGIDRVGGAESRAENAEEPAAPESPPAPPPDRPGQSGYPSRLESRRAAREAQEAARAERAETETESSDTERTPETGEPDTDAGTEGRGREPEETPPDDRDEQSPATETALERERDEPSPAADRPASGESEPQEQHPPAEQGERPPAKDADETTPESPQEPDRTEARETEDQPAQDQQPPPQQDGPSSGREDDEPSPTTDAAESDAPEAGTQDLQPGDEREAQPETAEATPAPLEGRDEPEAAEAEQAPDRPPLPQPDDRAPGGDTAEAPQEPSTDQTSEDEPTSSDLPERPEQPEMPPIQIAWPQQSGDGVLRWSSPIVRFNDRTPGTQPEARDTNTEAQQETSVAETDKPNKFRTLPDTLREGTPGRGEPIGPEDDPEQRDHLEPDPDTTRRRDRLGRRIGRQANEISDVGKKMGDGLGKLLDHRPPGPTTTGTGRDISTVHAPDQPLKAGDGAVGLAIGSILIYKAGRLTIITGTNKLREAIGRLHAGNR